MKRDIALILCAILICLSLAACGEEKLPEIDSGRVWDPVFFEDDSDYEDAFFAVTVPSLDNAKIEQKEDGFVYINGEQLIGGKGLGCNGLYLEDLTGDGRPEICLVKAWGSGIVDNSVIILEYPTKKCLFSLSDRGDHDYHLFWLDGKLHVMETEYTKTQMLRHGSFTYDGEKLSVVWNESSPAD